MSSRGFRRRPAQPQLVVAWRAIYIISDEVWFMNCSMIDTEEQSVDAERRGIDSWKRIIALLLLLLISLLALLRSSYTISTYHLFFSSNDTKISSSTATLHPISSETLPIYLIDTSDINQTNIAASTRGEISTNWNRTTQYSDLLSFATAVPSLPNQQKNNNNTNIEKKRRQIILIHCGPKLGSSTLRHACRKISYKHVHKSTLQHI